MDACREKDRAAEQADAAGEAGARDGASQLIRVIHERPDDSSYEEILRELPFAAMVERGIADSDAGRTIQNDEMGRRIESWRTSYWTADRDATVTLADATGQARLRLVVSAAGAARIDFLDENGKTVSSLPGGTAGR